MQLKQFDFCCLLIVSSIEESQERRLVSSLPEAACSTHTLQLAKGGQARCSWLVMKTVGNESSSNRLKKRMNNPVLKTIGAREALMQQRALPAAPTPCAPERVAVLKELSVAVR
jgi:hypothetical protein